MSALSSIRNNIGLVAIIIAIALVGFILTDFIRGITTVFGGPPEAGVVAGESISAVKFSERYNDVLTNYGGNLDDQTRQQLLNQTWDAMVSERVFEAEFDKTGLEVTGKEVYDMFAGENVSPIVRRYFQNFFDYQGKEFNTTDVKRYLELAQDDDQETARLREFEDYVTRARGIERYLNMVASGFVGSDAMARQTFYDQNKKVNLRFLAINYSQLADSLVKVTDSELESYIREHPKQYEQELEVFIRYAKFDVVPVQADSQRAYDALMKWRPTFASAQMDSSYTANKSRFPYGQVYQELAALPVDIRDSIRNATPGQVIGPLLEGSYYALYKLVGTEKAENPSVKINHILITPDGATAADSADARREASRIRSRANSGNFADLANEHSEDFSTKLNGGELGWYRPGIFGEDFDEAVRRGSKGRIIGPIKSDRGYHVVEIVDKTDLNYDIAQIEQEIYAGTETNKAVYREANNFAAKTQASEDINSTGADLGVNVFESNPLAVNTYQITGLTGGRQVIIWALQAEVNDFSEVLSVGDSYVYAQVVQRNDDDLRELEDVREEVERKVINQKKADYIMAKLAGQEGNDFESIKAGLDINSFVNTATNIGFDNNSIPGIGADDFVIGKALGMQKGEVSKVLEGVNGVYIIEVTEVTEPAGDPDPTTIATIKNSEVLSGRTAIQNKVEPALIDIADVVDERYKAGY